MSTTPVEGLTPAQAPPLRFRAAFERLSAEIRAVPDSQLIQIHLDIPAAVATALGAMSEVRNLRPLVEKLPNFDLVQFDKLEDYALALGHTHGVYLAAASPPRSLEELGREGAALRDLLLSDASALAARGVIAPERLAEIGGRGATGYRNIAFDLLTIVNVLREHWAAAVGKTAVMLTDLEKAEIMADRLLTAVGEKEQSPLTVGAAASDRQRAFSLFIKGYDQARRAAVYLHWDQDDADMVLPSLYNTTRGKRRRAEEEEQTELPTTTPATATPSTGEASGNGQHAIPVGMPGASPFQE